MTLAIICLWLVLDEFLGKKRISGWISSVMGNNSETFTTPTTNSVTNGLKDGNIIAESESQTITYVPGLKVPITRPKDNTLQSYNY